MKKYLIKSLNLIILFILIMGTHYSSLAAGNAIDTDITSNTFLNDFNPNGNVTGPVNAISSPIANSIVAIVNPIVGIIQVIGGILTVISIAMFGFGMILSSNGKLANELGFHAHSPKGKRALLDFGRTLLIGSVILFSSFTLVKFVLNIFIS